MRRSLASLLRRTAARLDPSREFVINTVQCDISPLLVGEFEALAQRYADLAERHGGI